MITSSSLETGSVIKIRPEGVEAGLRHAYDGVTYFGNKKKEQGEIVNDFLFKNENPRLGRHF